MQNNILINFQSRTDWKQYTPHRIGRIGEAVPQKPEKKVKIAAFVGTTIGVASAVALLSRGKSIKNIEYKGKEVLTTATGSVIGGLLGGSLADDKKHLKAKYREAITQIVGNFIVPTIFVSGGIRAFKLLEKNKIVPTLKPLRFAAGMGSLIAGVVCGNRMSNAISEKIFKKEHNRNVKAADWALQVDNTCLTLSLATSGTNIAKTASKVIPFAHLIPGYAIGTMQEKDNCNKA